MNKINHLIFYGTDGDAAKARAGKIRVEGGNAQIRHAPVWAGDVEPFDAVVVLPCVSGFDRARIAKIYGDKVPAAAASKSRVPPPPPVAR